MALPWVVLDSPSFARLSHPARSLLLEIARQYVRDNNGRLLCSMAHMKKRGWNSADTLTRAKRELLEAGFIFETVQGHRPNRASWYALTWRELDRHPDFDTGAAIAFERGAYRGEAKNASPRPSGGTSKARIAPGDGIERSRPIPADGAIDRGQVGVSVPADGNHLEEPSTGTRSLASKEATGGVGEGGGSRPPAVFALR